MKLPDDLRKHGELQARTISQTVNFLEKYDSAATQNQGLAVFDSIGDENIPDVLREIFDGLDASAEVKARIMRGVELGRQGYKMRNGGDDAPAHVIAFGLSAGAALLRKDNGRNAFDNIQGFDELRADNHEAISVVPAMTVVTIATAITNSLPIVAMLPNPIGSNEVPLVYARMTASKDWGGSKKGDFLDGEKASRQYCENRYRFAMAVLGAPTDFKYQVTTRVAYLDYAAKTPDPAAQLAPFRGGRVVIRVNGIEVANDHSRNNSNSSGVTQLTPVQGVEIGGTPILVASGTANLDTSVITVTFAAALPLGAKVQASVVFDFERKDANDNLVLKPPSVDITTEYASVYASESRTQLTASIDAITQMAQELGIGFMGAALALIQNKYYFEQTIRLLDEGKERAESNGRVHQFDASRGVAAGMVAAFNHTGDMVVEIFKTLNLAKLRINQATGASATAFDFFVNDHGAVTIKTLGDDAFTPTSTNFATHTEIVRIGTLADGTNVYHVPTSTELLAEGGTTTEGLLVARNAEPAKAAFVGHVAVAPMVQTANISPFQTVIGVYSRIAAEMNPLSRYADQIAVIEMINLQPLS